METAIGLNASQPTQTTSTNSSSGSLLEAFWGMIGYSSSLSIPTMDNQADEHPVVDITGSANHAIEVQV